MLTYAFMWRSYFFSHFLKKKCLPSPSASSIPLLTLVTVWRWTAHQDDWQMLDRWNTTDQRGGRRDYSMRAISVKLWLLIQLLSSKKKYIYAVFVCIFRQKKMCIKYYLNNVEKQCGHINSCKRTRLCFCMRIQSGLLDKHKCLMLQIKHYFISVNISENETVATK